MREARLHGTGTYAGNQLRHEHHELGEEPLHKGVGVLASNLKSIDQKRQITATKTWQDTTPYTQNNTALKTLYDTAPCSTPSRNTNVRALLDDGVDRGLVLAKRGANNIVVHEIRSLQERFNKDCHRDAGRYTTRGMMSLMLEMTFKIPNSIAN